MNLKKEKNGPSFELLDLFKTNERVGRSTPQKIAWTFEEQAKGFEENKRYKVWTPKTTTSPVDSDERLQKKLGQIKNAPIKDRWQLVSKDEKYPYLYLSPEVEDLDADSASLDTFSPVISSEELVEIKV